MRRPLLAAFAAATLLATAVPSGATVIIDRTFEGTTCKLDRGNLPRLRDAMRAAGRRAGYTYREERDEDQLQQWVETSDGIFSLLLTSTDGSREVDIAFEATPWRTGGHPDNWRGKRLRETLAYINGDVGTSYAFNPDPWAHKGPESVSCVLPHV